MRFLHTADWHLGQRFYDHDRTHEHLHFLDWLKSTIITYSPDALLIAGDVFDVANPSAEAQAMFYRFIAEVSATNPNLQIVIVAGNHDSASRLEAPSDLMQVLRVHVVGSVRKDVDGNIDYDSLIVPINDRFGKLSGYCLSVPYLRMSDCPQSPEEPGYTSGIRSFYHVLLERVQARAEENLPIVAMGHLHVGSAELSDSERSIRGGLEVVSLDTFKESVAYTALGHIHKAQRVDEAGKVRYSGSPLPMSFSEVNYRHQVLLVQIGEETRVDSLVVPRLVDLMRIGIPGIGMDKSEVIAALNALPEKAASNGYPPYLEINIKLDSPDPLIQNELMELIKEKQVLFCRSQSYYPTAITDDSDVPTSLEQVREVTPANMLEKVFQRKYGLEVPQELMALFNEVVNELD